LKARATINPDDPGKEWIRVDAQSDAAPEIIRSLVEAEIKLHQVVKSRRKLEELFLEVTSEEESHE
jgi:hypothetical protein